MKKFIRFLAFLLFAIGALSGMLLGAATAAAKLEAETYLGFDFKAQESFQDMDCPLILTGDAVGTISVTIFNPNEKEIEPLFQVAIGSERDFSLFRYFRERKYIPSGESQTMQWTVTMDDAVYRHFILVQVYQFAAFKTPAHSGSCGILYLDIPISGTVVLISIIAASVAGMILGIILSITLDKSTPIRKTRVLRAMIVMAICATLTMVTGILGIWILTMLFFAISVLLIAEVVRSLMAGN